MQEVLSRRFKRLEKDGGNFPDIVVIDGGKGQLSSAKKIIGKFHGCKTQILSLVKGPDRNSKYDDILCFSSGKIIRMNLEQEGKRLLQFVEMSHIDLLYLEARKEEKILLNQPLMKLRA